MPTVKGREEVAAFFDTLPVEIENKLLRGAARAGANVIADEAKERTWSDDIRDGLKVRTRAATDKVSGVVTVVGHWPRALATWAEYGTDPHVITTRRGTLAIEDVPIGRSVRHPGARKEPFLRPALDIKLGEAVAAAQAYINARVTSGGIVGADDTGDDEE
ncbi:HK97 gp10 family phage protein [Sphingomonas sp. KR1UV-12]|uniref:HK97 gp10 family phage protein n=1 Tax=Sphingomonas aurea TaxID=3063994 RepID=A0ABT9EHT3_9SPHN|nr:HK97 gp10 family phage protein [Sphingomonas sp. KR1UV-12]MDP1026392.1 HK97 gp10 family phage protein [Sphingomonas sp. KR1UV-12]